MQTILERNEITLVRDRSSFIGIILHVTNVDSVSLYIKEIKEKYPKAKHYCYAYKIGGIEKCSDDGEPAKTAGRPLMDLIHKKELDEVLIVVVRYFGGVLLGASRLMSTYLETGVQVVDSSDLLTIDNKFIYHTELTYHDYDNLVRLAKRNSITLENIVYNDKISLDILGDENLGHDLTNWFPTASIEVYGSKKVYKR